MSSFKICSGILKSKKSLRVDGSRLAIRSPLYMLTLSRTNMFLAEKPDYLEDNTKLKGIYRQTYNNKMCVINDKQTNTCKQFNYSSDGNYHFKFTPTMSQFVSNKGSSNTMIVPSKLQLAISNSFVFNFIKDQPNLQDPTNLQNTTISQGPTIRVTALCGSTLNPNFSKYLTPQNEKFLDKSVTDAVRHFCGNCSIDVSEGVTMIRKIFDENESVSAAIDNDGILIGIAPDCDEGKSMLEKHFVDLTKDRRTYTYPFSSPITPSTSTSFKSSCSSKPDSVSGSSSRPGSNSESSSGSSSGSNSTNTCNTSTKIKSATSSPSKSSVPESSSRTRPETSSTSKSTPTSTSKSTSTSTSSVPESSSQFKPKSSPKTFTKKDIRRA